MLNLHIAAAAAAFAAAFETRRRAPDAGGEEFVCLRDGAPDWMRDVVLACHEGGDMLPDDWRYRMLRSVAGEIVEILDENEDADLSEEASDRVDSLVPVYNSERAAWLASNVRRGEYVEEAKAEGMTAEPADIWSLLGAGIYQEIREIWDALASQLRARAESSESSIVADLLFAKGFTIEEGGAAPAFHCHRAEDGRGCIVVTAADGGEPWDDSWLVCVYAGEPMGEAFSEAGTSEDGSTFAQALAAAFRQLRALPAAE